MTDVEIHIFDKVQDYKSFLAGELIIREGEQNGVMYAVIDGIVDVYVGNKFLHSVKSGGIVGEMSLIDPAPAAGSVKAKTDCKLVPIDEARFQFLVQQTPFFALQVMRILVQRLREATEMGAGYLP